MRNIDRFRAMSIEEITPYLVRQIYIGEIAYWYSPSGYIFENRNEAVDNCLHWLDEEYHKDTIKRIKG